MAYTVLLDVKDYIGIDGSTADDALLTELIRRATSAIDALCLRTFEASANTTRYFDALQHVTGRRLILDRDLCSITSITNGDGTTVTSSQYVTYPRNETPIYAIQLRSSAGINWTYDDDAEDAIAISGKWAYSLTAPDSIAHACIRLTAFFYRSKDAQVFDQTAFSELGAIRMNRKLPSDIMEMLMPFRRAVTNS